MQLAPTPTGLPRDSQDSITVDPNLVGMHFSGRRRRGQAGGLHIESPEAAQLLQETISLQNRVEALEKEKRDLLRTLKQAEQNANTSTRVCYKFCCVAFVRLTLIGN